MRVTLVHPPNLQRSGKWEEQQVYRTPTNLALLASCIRQNGHEPKILDFDVARDSSENMTAQIIETEPHVVGFTCLTPRFPAVIDIARRCKAINPKIVTIIGGPHVSGLPQHSLNGPVDYGIVGEGEEALIELLDTLETSGSVENIANLVFRSAGRVKVNPTRPFIKDLDSLPLPAWDLLNLDAYREPTVFNGPHVGIISGRGCPYDCYFCASRVIWKRRARFRSAGSIVNEVALLVRTFGINEFMFYDDTFTLNRKRVLEICSKIQEQHLNIRFHGQTRADTVDLEVARALKEAGCIALAIGVESGDEAILRQIGKGETKEQIRSAVDVLRKVGLPCICSYIIGHPGDTYESIQATIEFAKELDAHQSKFMIATPYPGTRLYDMAIQRRLLGERGAEDLGEYTYYQHAVANLSCVSDDDLIKYQQEAYDNYSFRSLR